MKKSVIRLAVFTFSIMFCYCVFLGGSSSLADQKKDSKEKKVPRFLMVISEQNIGTSTSAWWTSGDVKKNTVVTVNLGLVENSFVEQFTRSGYQVVDHQVLSGKIKIPKPLQVLSPENKDAAEIGQLYGADYVIVGTAVSTTTANVQGSPIISATATVNVRIVSAKNGEIVATGADQASAMNANAQAAGAEALKKVAKKLSEKLVKTINSKPGIKVFVLD